MSQPEETILQAIMRHKDIVQLVPYDPKVNLPGTVTPGTVLIFELFNNNYNYKEYSLYNDQLVSTAIFFDQQNIPLIELIDNFIENIKIRSLELKFARPLPHINYPHLFYRPVLINECPARLICGYDMQYQNSRMTLDTIMPSKTWRNDPLL
jgi:hypothetical protein